jgi:hypothetical protein
MSGGRVGEDDVHPDISSFWLRGETIFDLRRFVWVTELTLA